MSDDRSRTNSDEQWFPPRASSEMPGKDSYFRLTDFRKSIEDFPIAPIGTEGVPHVELPDWLLPRAAELALQAFLTEERDASVDVIMDVDGGLYVGGWNLDALSLTLGHGTRACPGLNLHRERYGVWAACRENASICAKHVPDDRINEIARRLNFSLRELSERIRALPLLREILATYPGEGGFDDHDPDDETFDIGDRE